jgi:hypothetical protein
MTGLVQGAALALLGGGIASVALWLLAPEVPLAKFSGLVGLAAVGAVVGGNLLMARRGRRKPRRR